MEHTERADALERDADRLEHESKRLEEDIDQARSDWEARKGDGEAPGAVSREASGIEHIQADDPEEAPTDADDDDAGTAETEDLDGAA
ncbi:MAG TPA: hypothetical protein VF520_03930 [Thermoleophilaceae bacterium]|jgi:hypothetical protein